MDSGPRTQPPPEDGPLRKAAALLVAMAAIAILSAFSGEQFLLFHTLVEVASIAVAWAVFLLLWNARRDVGEEAYIVLGLALLGSGVLDLLHAVTFKGMIHLTTDEPADTPTQFWVAARAVETLGLLALPLLLGRRGVVPWAAAAVAALTTAAIHTILVSSRFPTCFVEGEGLTAFKVASEFVMVGMMVLASALLYRRRKRLSAPVHRLLQLALAASIAAELVFTLYNDVHGITVAVGHYFRIAARLAIYLALVQLAIAHPHLLLFRHLHQQQERLAASEQRWRVLSASSPDHIVDVDRDLYVRFANYPPPGLEMTQFLDRHYLDVVPGDQRSRTESVLREALAAGEQRRYQTVTRDAAGRSLHHETTAEPQRVGDVTTGLTLVIRDITAQHRQETLRAARLRIANHAISQDVEELLRSVSDEAAHLTGSRLGAFHCVGADGIARPRVWSADATPDGPDAVSGAGWRDCAASGQPVIIEHDVPGADWPESVAREALVPVRRKDRVVSLLGVADKTVPYHDDDVRMLAELSDLAWDMVERKRAEAARDESERRLIRTVANLPGMVYRCACDDRWTMELLSDTCLDLTGYASDELIGNRVVAYNDLIHPDDQQAVQQAIEASLPGRDFFRMTYRVLHRDGRVMWFWEQGRGVFEDDTLVALEGFIYDITARVRAEEERHAMEQRVLQTQKLESLGVLAGGIAHDFNNLLQAMLGYVQLAELEIPPDSPARENLSHVKLAARRASDLTSQMLAYSGRGRFTTEVFDLADRVREMSSLLRSSVPHTVELAVDPTPEPLFIEADPGQVQQVVLNLVINAAEAIGSRAGTVRLTLEPVTCSADDLASNVASMYPEGDGPAPGNYVALSVIDDGDGIEPDVLGRIFDPFFTTKFTGRGLGLAAVLGILRDHRGALLIETEPGCGSRFRVLIPRTSSADLPLEASDDDADLGAGLCNCTILVADDELAVRRYVTAALERHGMTVLQAANGAEAVAVFDAALDTIDGVLLDLTMPRLGGEGCLAALRQRRPELPVILMSGYSADELSDRFAHLAVSGILTKPFTAGELAAALRRALT